ncbi:MAG TPA: DnaJ domain-containing protein [Candidatus Hypogeohydataceae bacterium YC41]
MLEDARPINYYAVLQVHEGAGAEEIKRSFRRLVKEYHPDRNGNEPWAADKVKLVIQAYKTLSDASNRKLYDRLLNLRKSGAGVAGRPLNNLQTQARNVLLDLLDGKGAPALETYERLKKNNTNFHLLNYFTFKDYIDCTFLLAEEYERQRKHTSALELYEEAYYQLQQKARKQYLFDEIKDRIQRIYCRVLARRASPKEAILYYEKALELDLGRAERAFVHKKIAECHFKQGDLYSASGHLNIALSLKPNLRGVHRLLAWLNQSPPLGNCRASR